MKILHIIPNLSKGGAERLALDICIELSKRKNIEVCLVTFSEKNDYAFLSNQINYKVIPSKVIPSITRKPTVQIAELMNFIQTFKPNVIHSHLFEAEMVSRWQLCDGVKYFSHFHDNMSQLSKTFEFSKKHITNFYERQLILKKYKNCNNHFICISKDTLRYANRVLPSFFRKNTYLLYNAIDVKRFTRQVTKFPNELKLITIGSLVDKKNQQFLIEVVRILKDYELKLSLDILGDGPNYEKLKREIKEKNLDQFITLHGNVMNVEEFLLQSAIYVHSATYEPFGLVLLEAMAAGLPVVSLNGGGNADIMENGKNGFIIDKQDTELFADKIIEIWQNKELYNQMSSYAQEFAKQFDIREYVDKLLELYRN